MKNGRAILAVIIPVYNGEKYIFDSVMSVLNQPCKNLVVIVVDDGSNDSTNSILERIGKIDSRLIIIHQENAGVSTARNTGIQKSIEIGALYIAFLDSDDVWCSGVYDPELEEVLNENRYDLIGFNQYDCCFDLSRGNLYRAGNELKRYNLCHFGSYYYSVNVFKNNSVSFPERIAFGEDGVFYYVFASKAKSYYNYKKCLYLYRHNLSSVSHATNYDVMDYYIKNSFHAWDWVENKLNDDERAYRECETMKKIILLKILKMACRESYSVKDIHSKLKNNKIDRYLYDETIWLDEKTRKEYKLFLRKPYWFWLRNRVNGVGFKFVKNVFYKLSKIPFVMKIRYADDIRSLYSKPSKP